MKENVIDVLCLGHGFGNLGGGFGEYEAIGRSAVEEPIQGS